MINTEPDPNIEVKKEDLLFTRKNTRDLVGACAYVFETPSNLMIPDTIFRFKFKEGVGIEKLFIWGLFNDTKYKQLKIQKLAEGSAGSMPNISKKKLGELEIILPPFDLQSKDGSLVREVRFQKEMMQQQLIKLEETFQSCFIKPSPGNSNFVARVNSYAIKC